MIYKEGDSAHAGRTLGVRGGLVARGCCASSFPEQAACAHMLDGVVAIAGFHLPHDPAEVILHGVLRQVQTLRNFFVGQAIGNQVHQLHLPVRQSAAASSRRTG